jgi:hypothetical protein
MAKAKTASKNNPTTREKAKEVIFNGKKVKPVRFIGNKSRYMAIQFEDGSMAMDKEGLPLPWSKVKQ